MTNQNSERFKFGIRFASGLVILGGLALAVLDRNASAAIVIPTGVLIFLLADVDRIEVLKLLGAEAKLRTLDSKIIQADIALAQIRELSEIMSEVSFLMLAKLGRWDSAPSRTQVYGLSNRMRTHLASVGMSEEKVNLLFTPVRRSNIYDLASPVFQSISKIVAELHGKISREMEQLPGRSNPDDPDMAAARTKVEKIYQLQKSAESALLSCDKKIADIFQEVADHLMALSPAASEQLNPILTKHLPGLRHYVEHHEFLDLQMDTGC